MCGLSSSQVFLPFMLCSSCRQIERSLLLFLFCFSTYTSPALPLREESSLICYLTVESKQVYKQKENRFADPTRLTKKEIWFRIRLRDSEVTLWYFFKQC